MTLQTVGALVTHTGDGSFPFRVLHPILGKLGAFPRPHPLPGGRDGLKNRSLIFPLNKPTCSIEKEENSFRGFAFWVASSSFLRGRAVLCRCPSGAGGEGAAAGFVLVPPASLPRVVSSRL